MNILSGIDVTAGALNAQKTRLDIVAQNIANAQTTRGPDGLPYQRKTVSFETELLRNTKAGGASLQSVHVGKISPDTTPGARVYDPSHPDAQKDGFVNMPNVNMAFEMVDLMSASRAYEANLSVVKNSRQMALKAMEIGK
ncbi:flagellar basal body rod protein FlgC [Nibricoccus aquaticus]|uniref:Flagellar basal-body rod protein FlgC n=1 Tax=Nibricoccus aquaticus TaxID=2576891 RepID=A0A290Q5Y0_9BACT|nr:flagellar basal body rod protein FlgC [Nibricoccus aquaticus]ATC63677.1 flagellar basal body rod protein FlgC [Nibricoccus aquaticus]